MRPDLKIAVVGCGALGGYYGAHLCRAGAQTHFLLRSDFDTVRERGLRILSPRGDFHVRPLCASDPGQIGVCDLVLIGLKTTANARYSELLPPLVGESTMVLTLQNGLGNEEQLAALFPPGQILGGLCFVCLNRLEPGVVRHWAHGLVVVGEYRGSARARTHAVVELFRNADIRCKVTEDLEQAHWEKLVWNIPFNGLGVASAAGLEALERGSWDGTKPLSGCLATDVLLADPAWERWVRGLMTEVIAAARALGCDVDPKLANRMIEDTRRMGAYKASTLIDFERGQPLELESMFLEPSRRARRGGVAIPKLEALCRVLGQLDPARRDDFLFEFRRGSP